MASTKYTYSVSADTANSVYDSKLKDEIADSSIVTALDYILVAGDVLDIWMKDALSGGDQTTLTAVVNAHDGVKITPPIEVEFHTKSPITGRPEITVLEPEGDGEALPSHNFMDKSTWYSGSTRVTGETPSLISGNDYSLANADIVDIKHGKVTFEDLIESTYEVVITDNGTELTEDTDYTVDYSAGTISFTSAPTTPILADYSHASDSTFIISPPAGKITKLREAEIQFTDDVVMKPIFFEIWAYDPNDLPNKMMVFCRQYKNLKDIINVAKQGKGTIPAVDIFTKPILVFPFQYERQIILEDAKGMELRVKTKNDEIMGGTWGTITFYMVEEDEGT